MPAPWTSFLRSNSGNGGSGSASSTPGRGTPTAHARDKPLPTLPPSASTPGNANGGFNGNAFASPTLIGRDGERALAGAAQHRHNRSASHPLPKIFGRKKSVGNLADVQAAFDDGLMSPLDEAATAGAAAPNRAVSGGKKGARAAAGPTPGPDEDEQGKLQRKCMCCASRVKVPKELDKFRCLACLCINDLKPLDEQLRRRDEDGDGRGKASAALGLSNGVSAGASALPLTVERTRAVIQRCVVAYLEARCSGAEDRQTASGKLETPLQTPDEDDSPPEDKPIRLSPQKPGSTQLNDATDPSSPPDTVLPDGTSSPASAAIRNAADFDSFAYPQLRTPPRERKPTPHGPGPPSSTQRRPVPKYPERKPPLPPLSPSNGPYGERAPPATGNMHSNGDFALRQQVSPRPTPLDMDRRKRYDRVKTVFRPLEDYIVESYGSFKTLNSSFSTLRPLHTARAQSEGNIETPPPESALESTPSPVGLSQLDAKMLLLGDIGENSTWWTGRLGRHDTDKATRRKKVGEGSRRSISSKSPNIDWNALDAWYELVHTAGVDWQSCIPLVAGDGPGFSKSSLEGRHHIVDIDDELAQARDHTIRALLKVTENLLKRPGRQIEEPEELRWLLIVLANPSLYPAKTRSRVPATANRFQPERAASGKANGLQSANYLPASPQKSSAARDNAHQHSGLLKRTFGLLAGTNDTCHRYLIGWFTRLDEEHFTNVVDVVASFVTHRIARRNSRPRSRSMAADGGLIPDLSGSAMSTSAQLHSAMGLGGGSFKKANDADQEPEYANDWQIRAAAKVMSLLFAANNIWQGQRRDIAERFDAAIGVSPSAKARRSGQLLHTSSFYNTLLDYGDILADFKVWETKRDRFAFCQYPFFLSMGSKIKILEYDARRQMEIKAREAYFDSVIRQRALDGYFHLRVRRECMVDDSLRQISEAVGSGPEELKKGLRVHFTGEEGVDAGGPRKEWFLMLVRDIFDPNHGLFVYDDESRTCYFNPGSFETSDQYYLVGALLGLAIYNSTILDVALPPFAFRKLLAAAPAPVPVTANLSSVTGTKGQMTYTLSDLAEFRPTLATGLRQLLEFEGDVQETYCWSFVAPVERYGVVTEVPLIPNGEGTPVTNANRTTFVDAYVRYLLDTAVSRQFEPFKRGFFQVCAGNALSLFRAEEIELLVRGSDEALDVDSLRAVAVYEGWRAATPPHAPLPAAAAAQLPVIRWFWAAFAAAAPARQRQLLTFVTGTDRIPAVGATSLVLRIVAGAGASDGSAGSVVPADEKARFPVARTCFNMLVLWRYDSRDLLEQRLWRAVEESEGFGLK